jgi:hypothetical protein
LATGIIRSRNAWSMMFDEPSQNTATRFVVVEILVISSKRRAPPSSANFVPSSAKPICGPAAATPVITSASAPMIAAMSLFTPSFPSSRPLLPRSTAFRRPKFNPLFGYAAGLPFSG